MEGDVLMSQEMSVEQVKAIASELCSLPVVEVNFAGSGSNSRVFKVRTPDKYFALKFFRSSPDGGNTRLEAEVAASQFFKKFKISNTSELVQHSNEYNCALFNWIEGTKIEQITRSEIDEALRFLKMIFNLENAPAVKDFPFGIEACISGTEVVSQVNKRLFKLDKSVSRYPELLPFLEERFKPLMKRIITSSMRAYEFNGEDFSKQIRDNLLILSPVDFGFHNAIRKKAEVVFFDFEFFGWDDPTHLVADTVLHPGMQISDADKSYFVETAFDLLRVKDPFFEARYYALTPLYALRWACIILNPFLLDYQVVGNVVKSPDELSELRRRQLVKAELYINKAADSFAVLEAFNDKLASKQK
jgi:hypothetical protein